MGKGSRGNIKIGVTPNSKVKNIHDAKEDSNGYLVFDFSPVSAWRSCKTGKFNSYLVDEMHFLEKFRIAMKLVRTLSSNTRSEVFGGRAFPHCHSLPKEKNAEIVDLLTLKLNVSEQDVEGEAFSQVGLDEGFRMVGVLRSNVFRVYLVDYNHALYYDERKNCYGKTDRMFCPIEGWK